MQELTISNYTLVTAAGLGKQENLVSLKENKTGLIKNNFLDVDLNTWIGRVDNVEQLKLPDDLSNYCCRNNQLAYLALLQDNFIESVELAKKKYGKERVGVFLGTSTSGLLSTELAYRELENQQFKAGHSVFFKEQHSLFSVVDLVQKFFQLTGPAQVVSTACSSSAKVFATAQRYIDVGLCDAVIVGGVDSLCFTTLYGFNSLELLSNDICRPADKSRNGLSIGEAAAFILLEKKISTENENISLLACGESSDAYHMSTPHPQGRGAVLAMEIALANAHLQPEQIDYINLHGTATPVNDRVEDIAISQVFEQQIKCSSTKGWTGHTLGAAGAVEAIYCFLFLQYNFLPKSLNTLLVDDSLRNQILIQNQEQSVNFIASNSFGFGGNNCCLIFGRSDGHRK